MRILSVAVGIALLSTVAFADGLSDVTVKKETPLGPLKSVEGTVTGLGSAGEFAAQDAVVWINGYSTHPGPHGVWKILIPNEAVTSVVGYHKASSAMIIRDARDLKRVRKFKALSNSPEIRDLLNKTAGNNDVTSGGGDGGIRDLLNHPKGTNESETVTSGGGDGGIRDLLNKPKGGNDVTQGGGDGGIRDLLNKPAGNNDVTSGGGDGGIRDLLNSPPPQK